VAEGHWSDPRDVTAADRQACEAFGCCGSSAKYGATDIQRQVNDGKAIRRAGVETDHVFAGIFDEDGRLAGVAYHEPVPDSQRRVGVEARYLRFAALHDHYQQRTDPQGTRYSDLLLTMAHVDIQTRYPDTDAVLVRVHRGHARSVAMLHRAGYEPVPGTGGGDPLHIRALR